MTAATPPEARPAVDPAPVDEANLVVVSDPISTGKITARRRTASGEIVVQFGSPGNMLRLRDGGARRLVAELLAVLMPDPPAAGVACTVAQARDALASFPGDLPLIVAVAEDDQFADTYAVTGLPYYTPTGWGDGNDLVPDMRYVAMDAAAHFQAFRDTVEITPITSDDRPGE
ncbi:hypothetical protein BJY24_004116 [Nocardia transvalensis]|uniref:Uncharacterized protein n=1 Tax=Nocardia transvalensis TaxID=37333 RepID=A0A7W9PFI5_9NOCA|nr:hypothetical protein [Nocardia transvalensis]MBB5915249.1 hypothetical protein [Nocardia transvalensis]